MPRFRRSLFVSSLTCTLLTGTLACSSSSDSNPVIPVPDAGPPDGASNPDAAPIVPFEARFELPRSGEAPELLQVPFPSDLLRAKDGTIAIPLAAAGSGGDAAPRGIRRLIPKDTGARYLVEAFARTRGFGVTAGALFELTGGPPDASTLPTGKAGDCTGPDASVYLFDVDASSAIECQAAWNDDGRDEGTTPVLTVRPARGVVLAEAHRIAVLLTSKITAKSGGALLASASFAAMRDGARALDAEKAYGAAIDAAVAKLGVDKKRIVSAAVYTTGNVTDEVRQARELARAGDVPKLGWAKADVAPVAPARFTATTPLPEGWTASLDALLGKPNKLPPTAGDRAGEDDPDWGSTNPGLAHDAMASMGVAAFDAPSFLLSMPSGASDPTHGTFYHSADGKLAINPAKPTAKIWVTFVVPKQPQPAAGYPVVVFQHGMGGQRGSLLSMANSFARRGWATAAIEIVLHGTRGTDSASRGDTKNDFARPTSTYDGPDGFIDKRGGGNFPPTALFGELFRLAALRDQFRQSAIDHTTLVRLLRTSPTLDGLAQGGVAPRIDGTKVAYVGDSLGGIIGALTAGIEPDYRAYVLNVAGGGLLPELGANSPNIRGLLSVAAQLHFGFRRSKLAPQQPLVQMMQHVIDGGDPLAVARTAILAPSPIGGATPRPRNVLVYEVLADELVSNQSSEALARAMGLQLVKPHGPTLAVLGEADGAAGVKDVPIVGATGAIVQLFPAEHGSDLYSKRGRREYAIGPNFDDARDVFGKLETPIEFDNPYLETQRAAFDFIADAFDSKVPTLRWTRQPGVVKD